jgi:hypothetical protein
MKKKTNKPSKNIAPKNDTSSVKEQNVSLAKYKLTLLIALLIILACINIFSLYSFYFLNGRSGYSNTIWIYSFLIILCIHFLKNKIIRINLVVVLVILFGFETYLRAGKKGHLDYTENNSSSIFSVYQSRSYPGLKLINGLPVNPPNTIADDNKIEFNYANKFNELGFRERSVNYFANKNIILLLGDSFTQGIGAPADSTGPVALEYYLNQLNKRYAVYNAGVSGSDIVNAYKLLDGLSRSLHHQIVMYNLGYSDINDIAFRGGDERFKGRLRKMYWWEYLYSFSFISRLVITDIFHVDPNNQTEDDTNYAYDIIRKKIQDFQEYCKKHGEKFILIITPERETIGAIKNRGMLYNGFYGFSSMVEEMNTTGMNVNYIDTQNDFAQLIQIPPDLNNYYYRLDYHFRPIGYWFWGKTVAEQLIKKGLIH